MTMKKKCRHGKQFDKGCHKCVEELSRACPVCNLICSSSHGLKIHEARMHTN